MTARKSAALKKIQGTARHDRQLRVSGGVRLMVAPRPPAGLGSIASATWRRWARDLTSAGTLTKLDLPLLKILCEAAQDEAEAAAVLEREGWTIAGIGGGLKRHPALAMRAEARACIIRIAIEFGGSPRARQAVEVAPCDTSRSSSPWDQFKVLQEGRAEGFLRRKP